MSVAGHNRLVVVSCIVGILVTTYALYVEMTMEINPKYQALCDISEHMSCSKVLTSEFSKGLGFLDKNSPYYVPNPIYGIVLYCFILFLTTFDSPWVTTIQLLISLATNLGSIRLGYILFFVLHDFCLVCVTTYNVNIAISIFTYKKLRSIQKSKTNKRK